MNLMQQQRQQTASLAPPEQQTNTDTSITPSEQQTNK